MAEAEPTRWERWLGGLAVLGIVAFMVYVSLNQAASRAGSDCGTVTSLQEGTVDSGAIIRDLFVQSASGQTVQARARWPLVVLAGDSVCWHAYRNLLSGASNEVYFAERPASDPLYFPEFATSARRFDPATLDRILELSAATPPGEKLEELAEMASRYVRPRADVFLRAQSTRPRCFGVEFMGSRFVDNDAARQAEKAARRQALMAVDDPALAGARERCLAEIRE